MPRFAANLTTMYPEFEVPRRFEEAAADGFRAVEFLFPYNFPIADISNWLQASDLKLILINTPLGDIAAGERGLGALPGREADFRKAFDLALSYASELGAGMIHVMAGNVPATHTPADCEQVFIENLQHVAPLAQAAGITLLLEPLNTQDLPNYLHTSSNHACQIIERAGCDNIRLQFDFYHLQIMQGNLGAGLKRHLDTIGHIQFSSVPGRHEPQHGEVNAPFLFDLVDEVGYDGWIGCEYRPLTTTAEGLSWAADYGLGPAYR